MLSAQAWVLVDAVTGGIQFTVCASLFLSLSLRMHVLAGEFVQGYRQYERRCIASMTKIATASVVLMHAHRWPALLETTAVVSYEASPTLLNAGARSWTYLTRDVVSSVSSMSAL